MEHFLQIIEAMVAMPEDCYIIAVYHPNGDIKGDGVAGRKLEFGVKR